MKTKKEIEHNKDIVITYDIGITLFWASIIWLIIMGLSILDILRIIYK